ncbi:trafficking protein particle complex subunit 4-like protein Trs23 isoform X3 [Lycorma delicatula]
MQVLDNPENYPLTLRFARPRMTTNEKIFLASMFYPLFAIASQLSPEPKSSGIEVLEADTFKLHCFQTLTGVKFMVVAEPSQTGLELLLRKIYELYADYALKNPFYSLEMPVRCELFDSNLQALLEQVEKTGISENRDCRVSSKFLVSLVTSRHDVFISPGKVSKGHSHWERSVFPNSTMKT